MGSAVPILLNSTIDCEIWIHSDTHSFQYPENNHTDIILKENFGIALSGGGFRACTLALGGIRALYQMKILSRAKYISSNSGGSWLNGPLCYSKLPLNEFLGAYIPPHECFLHHLMKTPNYQHGKCLTTGRNAHTFIREILKGGSLAISSRIEQDLRDFWSQAVGAIFFRQYDLDNHHDLPSLPGAMEERLRQRCGLNDSHRVSTCRSMSEVPYPIINASVFTGTEKGFCPLEFTPLYYGSPCRCDVKEKNKTFDYGGYYIEPSGFIHDLDEDQLTELKQSIQPYLDSGEQSFVLRIPRPPNVISVSEQAGISSTAIAQRLADDLSDDMYQYLDFPMHMCFNPRTSETHPLRIADGGATDNSGILSLLRRKTSKIIAIYAMNVSIMADLDHSDAYYSSFGNIAALFGRSHYRGGTNRDGVSDSVFNEMRCVFPREDYDVLLRGLQSRVKNDKPATFLIHTKVLPNQHICVPGNHNVSILFVVNHVSPCWENSLPQCIRNRWKNDEEKSSSFIQFLERIGLLKSNLKGFPYIPLQEFDYQPVLVNLMSQLTTWQLMESKDLIEELLLQPD
mmetsp:Transcript_600/g.1005  ORF Transcript_600/g.1005 Transcript_600/m.1005 type:complete len:569 (-) Transcript_600:37-1743(-)